ncbi:MAG: hypothetical protein CR954_00765 [Candidatus Moraniibacteriota bacterium]|nr:MAG: hypothetical protein CR954_00765 [Candidatus Moranbacteria bacterium]
MKISSRQYAKLIYEEVSGLDENQVGGALEKIANLIKRNRDQKKMEQIAEKLEQLIKQRKGTLEAQVISAKPLEEIELEKVKADLAEKNRLESGRIELENIVEPEIKGGLIVKLENEIWDSSLRNKLHKVKVALIS